MSKRSRSSRVSNPITCWSVTHWASTPHGMPCPQAKKTSGTFRPLERGVNRVEGREEERTVHVEEALRKGVAESWVNVLDPHGAGRGAVRFPQFIAVNRVESTEEQCPVHIGEVEGRGVAEPWVKLLDQHGTGRGAVRFP